MRGCKVSDAKRLEIIADYARTKSTVETCRNMGLSQTTVYLIVSASPGYVPRGQAGRHYGPRVRSEPIYITPKKPEPEPHESKYEQSGFIAPPSLSRLMGGR